MGATTPDALPYPEQSDEVDVPTDLQELATATQAALHRALICTSSTRPSSPTDGLIIWESDTKLLKVYDALTTSWVGVGSGGGGGGGGATGEGGRWSASSAQSIPNTVSGPGTVVAFANAGTPTPTGVTRSTQGAGHKFALGESGIWAVSGQARVQSSGTAGEMSAALWADLAGGTTFGYNVDQDGGKREGLPRQLKPGRTTYLPAGTTVAMFVYNGTGSTRTLEPNAGSWVNIDLWRVG